MSLNRLWNFAPSVLSERELSSLWRRALLSVSKPLLGDNLFIQLTKLREQTQTYRYSAPAPPFEPIKVKPAEISWWATSVVKGWGLGQIQGGNWDTNDHAQLLEESTTRRGLRQRFIRNRDWEDTVYVQRAAKQIDEHGSFWGYESISEFRAKRCRYVDRLYKSIRKEGYVPSAEQNPPETDIRNHAQQARHNLEPLVAIGRDGRIFCVDGIHRFAIAEILNIEIPVNVIVRHRRWQRIRDQIATAQTVDDLGSDICGHLPHPDLGMIA